MDFLPLLAPDIQLKILSSLSIKELAIASRVSKTWKSLASSENLWQALSERDFKYKADSTTFSAALLRTDTNSPKDTYTLLARKRTCLRCNNAFKDGENTPSACNYHPGLLFSGGQLNGAALRFTCCSRRAHHVPTAGRDTNGCKASYHVESLIHGDSIWSPQGSTGATLRPPSTPHQIKIPAAKNKATLQARCEDYGIGSMSISPVKSGSPCDALEWHPNLRYSLRTKSVGWKPNRLAAKALYDSTEPLPPAQANVTVGAIRAIAASVPAMLRANPQLAFACFGPDTDIFEMANAPVIPTFLPGQNWKSQASMMTFIKATWKTEPGALINGYTTEQIQEYLDYAYNVIITGRMKLGT